MSQMIDGTIAVTGTWQNLVVANPSLANADTILQNYGQGGLRVFYGSSSSEPSGGGITIGVGDLFGGNAANIWVQAVGSPTTITVGLV